MTDFMEVCLPFQIERTVLTLNVYVSMYLEFGWENFFMESSGSAPPVYLLRIAAVNLFVYPSMDWLLN